MRVLFSLSHEELDGEPREKEGCLDSLALSRELTGILHEEQELKEERV